MSEADEKKNHLWSLRKKQEPNLTGDPGKSLMGEVAKLTEAVLALIEINKDLAKKLEQQQVCLNSIGKFVADQSSERPTFGIL
jgi:hypothetical protein